MKTVKFKNAKIHNKNRAIILILLTFLLINFFTIKLTNSIYPKLLDYALKKVKKENMLILKNAFSNRSARTIEVEKLLNVIKNSKEEIVEVSFDMRECYDILSGLSGYINEAITDYNFRGYVVDIPIGFLINSPLFANLGPSIPIKVELSDIALGNIRTKVVSFGINMAQIEVYADLTIDTTILYPFGSEEEKTEYSTLLASHIIAGKVPSLYGGVLSSSSGNIDIPLNQQYSTE